MPMLSRCTEPIRLPRRRLSTFGLPDRRDVVNRGRLHECPLSISQERVGRNAEQQRERVRDDEGGSRPTQRLVKYQTA